MPSPLSRQVPWSLFARPSPSTAAFPVKKSGRLLQLFFRGLLSVHSCYGLHARGVAKRPFPSKAPTASLPPLPFRLLFWEGYKSQGRRGGPPSFDLRSCCVWDVRSTVPPSLAFLFFLFFVAFATFPQKMLR